MELPIIAPRNPADQKYADLMNAILLDVFSNNATAIQNAAVWGLCGIPFAEKIYIRDGKTVFEAEKIQP